MALLRDALKEGPAALNDLEKDATVRRSRREMCLRTDTILREHIDRVGKPFFVRGSSDSP